MTTTGSLRRWCQAHPRAADAVLALLVLLPSVTVPADAPSRFARPTPLTVTVTVVACALLVGRRLRPGAVWALTAGAAATSWAVTGAPNATALPALVALYSFAARRPARAALAAGAATAGALLVGNAWHDPALLATSATYAVVAWVGLATATGLAVASQRSVVAAAEQRAVAAEASREEEAQRRVAEERLRIARELHDVVAHHISVVNVHSGVAAHLLESDPRAAADAVARVREASTQVLAEMAGLLGVLRTPDDGAAPRVPAAGLAELDRLLASIREAGLALTVTETGTRPQLPPLVDLTAYRVVQESLTNAHRHGTGTARLALGHTPQATTVEVVNPVRPGRGAGSGHGLLGMRERVAAAGGSLTAGPDGRGRFVVSVRLPVRTPERAA